MTYHSDLESFSLSARARREKLANMPQPYANDFVVKNFCGDLHQNHQEFLSDQTLHVQVAGRIMLKRVMGKALFLTIQDFTGKIQCYANVGDIGQELFHTVSHFDLGDCVWVKGYLFFTQTQELTIRVQEIRLSVKCLNPLPEKHLGLHDQEIKYRQRYLDLMTSDQTREVFKFRSELIHFMRNFFVEKRFIEVETPMMHVIPGGANARPFLTHHHALDIPLYLRIAPELFLKRLVVGGFDRVFEINRNFRNEGIS
ncbi:MAG: lysine--tRNA ligase, partial [Gammaproteobacteria bacterium]|nr:lysine--tRNA ligase [Gammaproteobacteria bacterium]